MQPAQTLSAMSSMLLLYLLIFERTAVYEYGTSWPRCRPCQDAYSELVNLRSLVVEPLSPSSGQLVRKWLLIRSIGITSFHHIFACLISCSNIERAPVSRTRAERIQQITFPHRNNNRLPTIDMSSGSASGVTGGQIFLPRPLV